jgi:hypothetical protein
MVMNYLKGSRFMITSAAVFCALCWLWVSVAEAVPGFARQTGMSCNQCHALFGGPTPNFTLTGKKFRALGYRTPHGRTAIESGVEGDMGERLYLPLFSFLSFRLQAELASVAKSPVSEEWGEVSTNPTSRVSWFFTGPVSDNIGVWNEWYIIPLGSAGEEWSLGLSSFDELDLRYIFNPHNPDYTIGCAVSNQPISDLLGFGPFPVSIGGGDLYRGEIRGYAHPNNGTLLLYGWMHDRWVWALGGNTGDNNLGWDYANALGQVAYAFRNGDDVELWLNAMGRTGSDVIPLITQNYVPVDSRDWAYRDAVSGISATRADDEGPYMSSDIDNASSATVEVRLSGQDYGPHSGEAVLRFGYNTEKYRDGATTDMNTVGFVVLYGYKHTYYVKPYVMSRIKYDFTDYEGVLHEIDNSADYGVNFGFKPKENFLMNLSIQNLQVLHLDEAAQDGGMLVRLYLDYLL